MISKQDSPVSSTPQGGKNAWNLHREREKTRPKALSRPKYKSNVVWTEKEHGLRAYLTGNTSNNSNNEMAKATMDELDRFEQALCKKDYRYAISCQMVTTPAVLPRDDAWLESTATTMRSEPRVTWGINCRRLLRS